MSKVINLRETKDRSSSLNVFGQPLSECSCEPMTGWFRDGFCKTDESDHGHHVVCCVMTDEFLDFSKKEGNDLSTPRPEFGFVGLKEGDHWCLCASRWKEAFDEGKAPQVVLESSHMSSLTVATLEQLESKAFTKKPRQ